MQVLFSQQAKFDLEEIVMYIAKDNPESARNFTDHMMQSLLSLTESPHRGRPGRVAGTRELILHKSYIAAYIVEEKEITILTVRHVARLWPEGF